MTEDAEGKIIEKGSPTSKGLGRRKHHDDVVRAPMARCWISEHRFRTIYYCAGHWRQGGNLKEVVGYGNE